MTNLSTSRVGRLRPARLGRYLVASVTALQLLIAVLAGGSVIGAFLVPGGSAAPVTSPALTPELIRAGAPMRLVMPALKVDAPVVPISMVGATLDPPRDYHEVGWWNASAKPGASQGQTVITGHTLHTGGASMNNLGELTVGNAVQVVSKRGTLTYTVTKKMVLTKKQLSKNSDQLFAQDRGQGRLVLITCSDWNGAYYDTNTIVFATPRGGFEPS